MSRSSVQAVTCPQCGEVSATDLWEWINVSLDPGLRDEVVSGELNRFECPDCGFEGQIERPLLYLDPHRSLALYAAPREWADDPDMWDTARGDANRLAEAVGAESLGSAPLLPEDVRIVYGYPRLANRVLGADALEALEDVVAPEDPSLTLSEAAQRQLGVWRDLIGARNGTDEEFAEAARRHRGDLRLPLLSVLFSGIGRAARGDDPYLADYLRSLGDAALAAAMGDASPA